MKPAKIDAIPSTDPRIVRSEAAICAALESLLEAGQSPAEVTVSELADRAGVTRKTFYSRFGTLDQVMQRMVADLFGEIARQIEDTMLVMPVVDDSLAMLVFRAYEGHRDRLTLLIRYCPTSAFVLPVGEILGQLLDRIIAVNNAPALDDADRTYLVAMVASLVHGVLSVWVQRGFAEAPEQVAKLMDALISDGLQKIIKAG